MFRKSSSCSVGGEHRCLRGRGLLHLLVRRRAEARKHALSRGLLHLPASTGGSGGQRAHVEHFRRRGASSVLLLLSALPATAGAESDKSMPTRTLMPRKTMRQKREDATWDPDSWWWQGETFIVVFVLMALHTILPIGEGVYDYSHRCLGITVGMLNLPGASTRTFSSPISS
eukprot:COSAG03_NODE_100_length_12949_cov_130.139611_3_plen_172_part_00